MTRPYLFRPMNGSTPGITNAIKVRELQAENTALNKQKNALVRLLVAIVQSPDTVVPIDDGLMISRPAFSAVNKRASVRLQLGPEFVEVHVVAPDPESAPEPKPEPSRIILPGGS